VRTREATPDDAAGIARVCNEIAQLHFGEGDVDEASVRQWFEIPRLHMLVAESDDAVVGYMDVRDDEGERFPIDVRTHDPALADRLYAAAEDWARTRARPGAVVRGFVAERDAELAGVLAARGYRTVRHSFQMLIELSERVEPAEWPEGISVRPFESRDEEAVYECVQESFAGLWDYHRIPLDEWRVYNLTGERFDPGLLWLAEDGGELAGVSLNYWHVSGDGTYGWIGTLGVRRPWRKRGLGRALLRHSFRDFQERGATRVGLGVDAQNPTGAVRLYESVGMRPVRRNDTYEKAL
jgi:ribosomal protein S18 acetylase RimI-like enzyme